MQKELSKAIIPYDRGIVPQHKLQSVKLTVYGLTLCCPEPFVCRLLCSCCIKASNTDTFTFPDGKSLNMLCALFTPYVPSHQHLSVSVEDKPLRICSFNWNVVLLIGALFFSFLHFMLLHLRFQN